MNAIVAGSLDKTISITDAGGRCILDVLTLTCCSKDAWHKPVPFHAMPVM
jgi:hypothetical protein